MSILRKTIVATALLGAGLGATTGAAFATESGHDGPKHETTQSHEDGNGAAATKSCTNGVAPTQHGQDQSGLANASDVQTTTPLNGCNNNIPVNVLGVQVPVQDAAANAPVASPTDADQGGDNGGDQGAPSPLDGIL